MHAKVENNQIVEYPVNDIRRRFLNVSLPRDLTKTENLPEGYVWVKPVSTPTFDSITQRLEQGVPVIVDGEWIQTWNVVNLDEETIEFNRRALVPFSVTRFQARMALRAAGLFDAIEDMMSNPATPVAAVEAWNSAQEFRRQSPTILALAQSLGLTDQQLDDLFIMAARIEA